MLSYIHAYHAGNHGDILKHITFSLTLEHLLKKDKPFTVIDTHAASGLYTINDERLLKTGEAEQGIIKFINNSTSLLKDLKYYSITKLYLSNGFYPGSPEIARIFMRKDDQLILNELHPQVIKELKENVKKNVLTDKKELPQTYVHNRNAEEFLTATVPPKIKRGCVIIDPSYEDSDDFFKTSDMTSLALKKWSNGTFLIWYPLLEHRASEIQRMKEVVENTAERLIPGADEKTKFYELKIKDPAEMTGLANMYGSGMIIVNPPYGLDEKMKEIIPKLEKVLR